MAAIEGQVAAGYEAVAKAFAAAFEGRPAMGAALTVRVKGEPVINLWGGVADARSGAPWSADTASVDAENLDRVSIDDSGSYMLAAYALKSEKDKPVENQITIARTNRIAPAGATAGSELAVTIENDLTVIAMPDPAAP